MASYSDYSSRQSRPIDIHPQPQYFTPNTHAHTPPYGSAEEGYPSGSTSRSYTRPMMMPRHTYPAPDYAGVNPASSPSKWMNPRHMHMQPDSSPAFTPQLGSSSTTTNDGFSFYPQSFPVNPYMHQYPPPPATDLAFDPNFALIFEDTDNENASPAKASSKPPPRPPNAWIIYRSEMLKAIADGKHIPGLEAVMAECGISSGESPGDENTDGGSKSEGEVGAVAKKKKAKKPKKGSKEPTAGMLTLGKGKTGRGIPQADVSKLISMMWARETPDNKKKYERQSELQKIEHQRRYPDYKFQPQKRADKLKQREEREKAKAEARMVKKQEKQALTRAKRKSRSKPSPSSPYAPPLSRSASGSGGKDDFGVFPFPFPQENVPSMQASDLPFPEAGSSKALAWSAAPRPLPPANPPTWTDIPDIGPAYAVPYIFEAVPFPDSENLHLFGAAPEESDADALAALWCAVEEEPVAAGEASNTWDVTAPQAMEQWSELGSYPQPSGPVPVSSSFAHQLAQDWTQTQALQGYSQPIYQPEMVSIPLPYVVQGEEPAPGPFLSTNQPLSPVEAWSTQGAEGSMSFRQALAGNAFNRLPSTTGSDNGLAISPSTGEFPRHVSSSAFPATPLSVETAGWTDRTASFSSFAAQMHHPEADDLWGEDEDDFKPAHTVPIRRGPSGTSTPIDSVISSITNTSGSSSDASTRSGPPRGIRRPRTVGAAFVEQAGGSF